MAALLLYASAASGWAQPKADWEREEAQRNWREIEVAPPAFPQRADWLAFHVDAASEFRFYVDRGSLSVGSDRVVRFVLVAVSPFGAENISFEGLRCDKKEHKTYATGRADRSWSRREGPWRRGTQRWQTELRSDFFCPQGVMIASPAEGIDALRRGGHPNKGPVSYD